MLVRTAPVASASLIRSLSLLRICRSDVPFLALNELRSSEVAFTSYRIQDEVDEGTRGSEVSMNI